MEEIFLKDNVLWVIKEAGIHFGSGVWKVRSEVEGPEPIDWFYKEDQFCWAYYNGYPVDQVKSAKIMGYASPGPGYYEKVWTKD